MSYLFAYDEGYDAFWTGQPCPYEKGSIEEKEWNRGWRSADLLEDCKNDYINGETDE